MAPAERGHHRSNTCSQPSGSLQGSASPSRMGNRSTGAIHPHTCSGTWADTHLGTPEGHSRVIPPWEEGVRVVMMKQSQCLNLERSKEHIPIPAEGQHHLTWSSAMSTCLKVSGSH